MMPIRMDETWQPTDGETVAVCYDDRMGMAVDGLVKGVTGDGVEVQFCQGGDILTHTFRRASKFKYASYVRRPVGEDLQRVYFTVMNRDAVLTVGLVPSPMPEVAG